MFYSSYQHLYFLLSLSLLVLLAIYTSLLDRWEEVFEFYTSVCGVKRENTLARIHDSVFLKQSSCHETKLNQKLYVNLVDRLIHVEEVVSRFLRLSQDLARLGLLGVKYPCLFLLSSLSTLRWIVWKLALWFPSFFSRSLAPYWISCHSNTTRHQNCIVFYHGPCPVRKLRNKGNCPQSSPSLFFFVFALSN